MPSADFPPENDDIIFGYSLRCGHVLCQWIERMNGYFDLDGEEVSIDSWEEISEDDL